LWPGHPCGAAAQQPALSEVEGAPFEGWIVIPTEPERRRRRAEDPAGAPPYAIFVGWDETGYQTRANRILRQRMLEGIRLPQSPAQAGASF